MRFLQLQRWYGHYLADEDIDIGGEYLYCPLNKPPKRVKITRVTRSNRGVAIVYHWREVRSNGMLSAVEDDSLSLFRAIPVSVRLKHQIQNPIVMLRGTFTGQLRRPARVVGCQC